MSAPLVDRPTPIREAFRSVGSSVTYLTTIVTSLVGWGVLTGVQGDALVGLLGIIPGAVAAVGLLLQAFHVIRAAEPNVTPVENPAVEVPLPDGGVELVPLIPDPARLAELGIATV